MRELPRAIAPELQLPDKRGANSTHKEVALNRPQCEIGLAPAA